MKPLIWLLVLANVCFFAFTQIDHWSDRNPETHLLPHAPERLRLLSPQEVAALGPSKVAQLNTVCAEWGPFNDPERARATKRLDALQLGKTLFSQKVDIEAPFWVMIEAKPNREQLERAVAELKKRNIDDIAPITDTGKDQFAISLGVYRGESAARARLAEIEGKGVKTAKLVSRTQKVAHTLLVIREPTQATMIALEGLKGEIAGSELKIGTCPERAN